MPTLLLKLNQTDNGKTLNIKDVTEWTNPTDTGVANVVITIKKDTTTYTVVDEVKGQPCAQGALEWNVASSAVGFGTSPFIDDIYTVNYAVTISSVVTTLEAKFLLDYNSKRYVFELYENGPYQLAINNFAYNPDIKKIQIADVLLKGMQYAAAAGQVIKAKDILNYFERFKRLWQ